MTAMDRARVVVVTGASSGIGEAVARKCASHGDHLVLGARRLDRLEELSKSLSQSGAASVLPIHLDVRDQSSVADFVTKTKQKHPQIDVLVNNAGLVLGVDRVSEGKLEDWETIIDVNVLGVLRMCRALVPSMEEQQAGHVVMIGSIAGHQPYEGGGTYCASKHALKALTQTLKLELNGKNIRVTTIDPGMVETEFSIVRLGDEEKAKKVYEGLKPLAADDIASCVDFALSCPAHVNIDSMLVTPTAQASVYKVSRQPES